MQSSAPAFASRHILEKLHKDGTVETPEWHRARAKRLRQNGFTKMAEQHEEVAQAIERRRHQAK
jgi:hypothetical protein